MALLDGGSILVAALKKLGVKTVFTLHGGHLDSAYQAAIDQGILLVDTRHEQAAGLAASGYARVTGEVGVAMVTAGGGITNIVTAVANAYADCVSLVVIGGAPPLRDFDTLPVNGGIDQMSVMTGITKWSHRLTHIERLPDLVGRAFQIAREGRPGPVYIEIASDIMFAKTDSAKLRYPATEMPITKPAPSPDAIAGVLALLAQAKRPVILAGGGVAYSQSSELLRRFSGMSGIPVLTNAKARGALPTDHPMNGRGFASLAAVAAASGVTADLVILLGARLGIYTGGPRLSFIAADAKVIQVDIRPEEIGRIRHIDLGIAADCEEMLRALIDATAGRKLPDWSEWLELLRSAAFPKGGAVQQGNNAQVHPQQLAREVANAAPEDSIFVLDGGETPGWLDAVAVTRNTGRWLGHGYMGVMGEGLPLAVGAQVAKPNARVICFTGDGSIGFNFAEFDTMVRHKLPIVVVVNNDRQWGMSAHGQDLMYGRERRVVSELLSTRYDLAAQGFGAHGEYVERLDQLAPALARALACGGPACVNVVTDREVVHPITPRMLGRAAGGLAGEEGRARIPYADVLEV